MSLSTIALTLSTTDSTCYAGLYHIIHVDIFKDCMVAPVPEALQLKLFAVSLLDIHMPI